MSAAPLPFVRSILHPTDLGAASRAAFAHALAIALFREAKLAILHAGGKPGAAEEWEKFPPVRKTLEAWKLLEPGSPRSAVYERLRVKVTKVEYEGDPLDATLDYAESHDVDLLVLGTSQREGLPRWLHDSTASKLVRSSRMLSLIVPEGARGFVSPDDGSLHLRSILVPVDRKPDASRALVYASRACIFAPGEEVVATVLHVGDAMPELRLPADARCRYETALRPGGAGDVVDEIAAAASERKADLLIMPSDGRDRALDLLRGSFSERVTRRVTCPVLIVPES